MRYPSWVPNEFACGRNWSARFIDAWMPGAVVPAPTSHTTSCASPAVPRDRTRISMHVRPPLHLLAQTHLGLHHVDAGLHASRHVHQERKVQLVGSKD